MTEQSPQPSIVTGEAALETFDRLDMRTNITVMAIVDHYRVLVAHAESLSEQSSE